MSLAQLNKLFKKWKKCETQDPWDFPLDWKQWCIIFNIHLTVWESPPPPHLHVMKCICSEKWVYSTGAQNLKTTQHNRDYWFFEVRMLSESFIIVARREISVSKSAFAVANTLSRLLTSAFTPDQVFSMGQTQGYQDKLMMQAINFFPFYFLCSALF